MAIRHQFLGKHPRTLSARFFSRCRRPHPHRNALPLSKPYQICRHRPTATRRLRLPWKTHGPKRDSASLTNMETVPWFPQTKSRQDGISGSASEQHRQRHTVQAPIPQVPEWPWRHVIHVADTIPLTENRLRYYDHPVIKVIALWRELSWYEVFAKGQRKLSAAESSAP